ERAAGQCLAHGGGRPRDPVRNPARAALGGLGPADGRRPVPPHRLLRARLMPATPADPGTVCVLGFDVGARRIGVAVGNTLSQTARPLAVVEVGDRGPDWARVDALVREWVPNL